jgi:hypothetical protein
MQRMLFWLTATLLATAGCKDEGIEALTAIKAKACACKDAACIAEVTADIEKAGATKKTTHMEEASKLAKEIGDCMLKVQAATEAAADAPAPAAGSDQPADPAPAPAPTPTPAPAEPAAPSK